MDRLEKIRAKRASLDAEALAREEKKAKAIAHCTSAIKRLATRLTAMMVLADEMVKNRISFGGTNYIHGLSFGDNFETNGITHNIGFVFEYPKGRGMDINYRMRVIGIGIEGGGCCGNDIVIDRNGDIVINPLDHVIGCWTKENAFHDFSNKVTQFLNGFDEFEKKFYDYVDNL